MASGDDRAGVMAIMTSPALDPRVSVKEVLARYPATLTVFQQFGIHLCCGSDASITEAALRDGAGADALMEALRLSILAAPAPDPAASRTAR